MTPPALERFCEQWDAAMRPQLDALQRFSDQLVAWTQTPEYRAGRREALKRTALEHLAQQAAARATSPAHTATRERALRLLEDREAPTFTRAAADPFRAPPLTLSTGWSAHAPPRIAAPSRGAAA